MQANDTFIEGHKFVPYDGACYEIIYRIEDSEIVHRVRFDFGPPCVTIDLDTNEPLSKDVDYLEIKAWRELKVNHQNRLE